MMMCDDMLSPRCISIAGPVLSRWVSPCHMLSCGESIKRPHGFDVYVLKSELNANQFLNNDCSIAYLYDRAQFLPCIVALSAKSTPRVSLRLPLKYCLHKHR